MNQIQHLLRDLAHHGARVRSTAGRLQLIHPAGSPPPPQLVAQVRQLRPDLLGLARLTAGEASGQRQGASQRKRTGAGLGPATEPLAAGSQMEKPDWTQGSQENIADDEPRLSSAVDEIWGQGFRQLLRMASPLGFTHERWHVGVHWCGRLAREHGDAALELGWTAAELFGLHPVAPAARYDAMGLAFLLRPRDRVLEIHAGHAPVLRATGTLHRFDRRVHSAESRPAWSLPL